MPYCGAGIGELMITHRIIKVKEKVPIQSFPTKNLGLIPKRFTDQAHLDIYIQSMNAEIGDIFYLGRYSTTNRYSLHMLVDIELSIIKVSYSSNSGEPQIFRFRQIFHGTPTPWVRWDNIIGYQKLTGDDLIKFRKDNHDHLQNIYKEYPKTKSLIDGGNI